MRAYPEVSSLAIWISGSSYILGGRCLPGINSRRYIGLLHNHAKSLPSRIILIDNVLLGSLITSTLGNLLYSPQFLYLPERDNSAAYIQEAINISYIYRMVSW